MLRAKCGQQRSTWQLKVTPPLTLKKALILCHDKAIDGFAEPTISTFALDAAAEQLNRELEVAQIH